MGPRKRTLSSFWKFRAGPPAVPGASEPLGPRSLEAAGLPTARRGSRRPRHGRKEQQGGEQSHAVGPTERNRRGCRILRPLPTPSLASWPRDFG